MRENNNLIASLVSCIIAMLMCSQMINENIIKPRLYDGTVNNLGRYSFTFDAYEYIAAESDSPVIAIGSSKMREIFNGISIGENSTSEADFFNLAYGMDMPYVRMIELDYLINSNPELVIIEMGPSTFSQLDSSVWHYNRTIEFMSHLISMKPYIIEPEWAEIIENDDKDKLPLNFIQQSKHWFSYSQISFEYTLEYQFNDTEPPFKCEDPKGHVRCAPHPSKSEEKYDDYLRYPFQLPNILAQVKETGTITNSNGNRYSMTIERYYGQYLDERISNPYHNPQGIRNHNHDALDYIINKLVEHDIEVLLVGIPYNPVLLDRLEDNKWDYYNQSMWEYSQNPHIHVIDYMWDKDWDDDYFSDLAHASKEGENFFTQKITPEIDLILTN